MHENDMALPLDMHAYTHAWNVQWKSRNLLLTNHLTKYTTATDTNTQQRAAFVPNRAHTQQLQAK